MSRVLRIRRSHYFYFLATLFSVVLSIFVLEAMSAVYFEFFSEYFYRPIYLRDASVLDWRTEFEPWGAWHRPNASVVHHSPCFTINYTSNSIGARDVERASPGNPNSVIFLGDSFIEGFGVKDDERLSNIFEKKTGRASINLGAAGHVGPLQYWMLYETFAHRYAHDAVVIGFLPINDFTDNDPEFSYWKYNETFRYRPYYKRINSTYEIFHKGTFEYGRTFQSFNRRQLAGARATLMHYTWTGGFLFARRGLLQASRIESRDVSARGYFEPSRERIDAAFYFLQKIVESAPGINVYILVIPSYSEAKELRVRSSPWLSEFVERFQRGHVSIIDLGSVYAGLSDDVLRSAFLQCDGHWSARGNAIAADALLEEFSRTLPTTLK